MLPLFYFHRGNAQTTSSSLTVLDYLSPLNADLTLDGKELEKVPLYSLRSAVIPCFLYKCKDRKTEPWLRELKYERSSQNIFIAPEEFSFRSARLIFINGNNEWQEQLPPRGIREGKFSGEGTPAFLYFEENSVRLLIESLPHLRGEENFSSIPLYTKNSFISLKGILDPDGGFERLLEDLRSGTFPAPQRERMHQLLDILRAASPDDELVIFENLADKDPGFFKQVVEALFRENLLPYMSKREIYEILLHLPEKVLQTLAGLPADVKERFRPFFSRRRFEELSTASPEKESEEELPLFFYLMQAMLQKYPTQMYRASEETGFLDREHCTEFFPENYSPLYIISGELFREIFRLNGKLYAHVTRRVEKLLLYIEIAPLRFIHRRLRVPSEGLFELPESSVSPRRIIAVDENAETSQTLAQIVRRKIS